MEPLMNSSRLPNPIDSGGRPRYRVLATLGKRDAMVASGAVDGLLQSTARFSEKLRVVDAVRTRGTVARSSKLCGPPLMFQCL